MEATAEEAELEKHKEQDNKLMTPKTCFAKHLQDERKAGNKPVSDTKKSGRRVVIFKDGGKLELLKSGHMIHTFSNDKKVQCNPDCTCVTVLANGTRTQVNPNGNTSVKYKDGTVATHLATGKQIFVYPDGRRKQFNGDGSGIHVGTDGKRTAFESPQRGERESERLAKRAAEMDAKRLAKEKAAKDEEERLAKKRAAKKEARRCLAKKQAAQSKAAKKEEERLANQKAKQVKTNSFVSAENKKIEDLIMTASRRFRLQIRDEKKVGNRPVSHNEKDGGVEVVFQDAAKIQLLESGHVLQTFSDGKRIQRNPSGTLLTVEADGTQTQVNTNGNKVVQLEDGTSVTHLATGAQIFVYPDGRRKQVNVDGSGLIVGIDGKRTKFEPSQQEKKVAEEQPANKVTENNEHENKVMTPTNRFRLHYTIEKKAGNEAVSREKKNDKMVIIFKDGGKLQLLKSGFMVHIFSNGKKVQANPDGKLITIEADGTHIQLNPDGSRVVKGTDGTTVTHFKTGQQIFVYPDGRRKQLNIDGSGFITGKDGKRTQFASPNQREQKEVAKDQPANAEADRFGQEEANAEAERLELERSSKQDNTKTISPATCFEKHVQYQMEEGNEPVSGREKDGERVVIFKDGGKLQLLKTVHMLHNGKKVQCNPDSTLVTVAEEKEANVHEEKQVLVAGPGEDFVAAITKDILKQDRRDCCEKCSVM